jgi:hypothetical protein
VLLLFTRRLSLTRLGTETMVSSTGERDMAILVTNVQIMIQRYRILRPRDYSSESLFEWRGENEEIEIREQGSSAKQLCDSEADCEEPARVARTVGGE